MLEQLNNALTFYAHFVESKLGKTGLTVTVDVYRNGTEIVTAAAATEAGDGLYRYTLAAGSNNAEGEYVAIFKTATTTVDQRELPAIILVQKAGVEYLNSSVTVTIATPVAANRKATVRRADDYSPTDNRAFKQTVYSPDLNLATATAVVLNIRNKTKGTKTTVTGGTVTATGGGNYELKAGHLTSAQTDALIVADPYEWDFTLTVNNRVVTPVEGPLVVTDKLSG